MHVYGKHCLKVAIFMFKAYNKVKTSKSATIFHIKKCNSQVTSWKISLMTDSLYHFKTVSQRK